jgi:hypothetical protein
MVITTRPEPTILEAFTKVEHVVIREDHRGHATDLETYVSTRLRRLQNPDDVALTTANILASSRGMWLYGACHTC